MLGRSGAFPGSLTLSPVPKDFTLKPFLLKKKNKNLIYSIFLLEIIK